MVEVTAAVLTAAFSAMPKAKASAVGHLARAITFGLERVSAPRGSLSGSTLRAGAGSCTNTETHRTAPHMPAAPQSTVAALYYLTLHTFVKDE